MSSKWGEGTQIARTQPKRQKHIFQSPKTSVTNDPPILPSIPGERRLCTPGGRRPRPYLTHYIQLVQNSISDRVGHIYLQCHTVKFSDYLNTVIQKYVQYVELRSYECEDIPSTLSLAAYTWNDFKISVALMALLRLWIFKQLHGALPFGGPRKGLIADFVPYVLFEHQSSRKETYGSPYKRVHKAFPSHKSEIRHIVVNSE